MLKELAAKPEDLSSILGTHMAEEEDQPQTSSDLHIHDGLCDMHQNPHFPI